MIELVIKLRIFQIGNGGCRGRINRGRWPMVGGGSDYGLDAGGMADGPHSGPKGDGPALGFDQAEMTGGQFAGIVEQSLKRVGVGQNVGQPHLAAKLQPGQADEHRADRTFQLVRDVEHEAAIGGRQDAQGRVADLVGQFLPSFTGDEPRRDVRMLRQRPCIGRPYFATLTGCWRSLGAAWAEGSGK